MIVKKLFILFFVITFQVSYSQECDECIKKVTTDPRNPLQRWKKLAEKYQYMSHINASSWMLYKTALKYCGYCLSENEKGELLRMISAAETNLKSLQSKGPTFSGNDSPPGVTLSGLKSEFEAYRYSGATGNLTSTETTGVQYSDSESNDNSANRNGGSNSTSTSKSVQVVKEEYEKIILKNSEEAKSISENAKGIALVSPGKEKKSLHDDDLFKTDEVNQVSQNTNEKVSALKQKAMDLKLDRYNESITKNTLASSKTCTKINQTVSLSHVIWSDNKSKHSIDSSQPWSNWVAIPGTALKVRYSEKRDCEEPEFPNTTNIRDNLEYISKGVDQFFDYGFIQFSNTSGAIVSGKVTLTIQGDGAIRTENWPFYLEPNTMDEEALGNWYTGCSLISLQIAEYCTNAKR